MTHYTIKAVEQYGVLRESLQRFDNVATAFRQDHRDTTRPCTSRFFSYIAKRAALFGNEHGPLCSFPGYLIWVVRRIIAKVGCRALCTW